MAQGTYLHDHNFGTATGALFQHHIRPSQAQQANHVIGVMIVLGAAILPAIGIAQAANGEGGVGQLPPVFGFILTIADDVKGNA